jgi:hypothetical protein
MSHSKFLGFGAIALAFITLGFMVLAGGGCWSSGGIPRAPSVNAHAVAERAVEQYGKDGQIAGADLDKAPSLKSALKRIDVNGDGIITTEEIVARIQSWKEAKINLILVNCVVNRKKGSELVPIEGATVTFEPEKFMGADYPPASGETDKDGAAIMAATTLQPKDPQGLFPGFYLVRITRPDGSIPAKYNTQTILGVEISQDPPFYRDEEDVSNGGGCFFDLEY